MLLLALLAQARLLAAARAAARRKGRRAAAAAAAARRQACGWRAYVCNTAPVQPSPPGDQPRSLLPRYCSSTNLATSATASTGDVAFSRSAPMRAAGPSVPHTIRSGTPLSWMVGWCLPHGCARGQARALHQHGHECSGCAGRCRHARQCTTGCGITPSPERVSSILPFRPLAHQHLQQAEPLRARAHRSKYLQPAVCHSRCAWHHGNLAIWRARRLHAAHLVSSDALHCRRAAHAVGAPADAGSGVRVCYKQDQVRGRQLLQPADPAEAAASRGGSGGWAHAVRWAALAGVAPPASAAASAHF